MEILLVEDTRAARVLLTEKLSNLGHEVITAENGQIAVVSNTPNV